MKNILLLSLILIFPLSTTGCGSRNLPLDNIIFDLPRKIIKTSDTLTIIYTNTTDCYDFSFGDQFYLKKLINGNWESIDYQDTFLLWSENLTAGKSVEYCRNLILEPGKYLYIKEFTNQDNKSIVVVTVEFEVKDNI